MKRPEREAVLRVGAAAGCLALAAFLVLIALDAQVWRKRIAADDIRVRATPIAQNLWRPTQAAPFGLARRLLGLDDDLAYRNAVREFRVGRPLELLFTPKTTSHRAEAQALLSEASRLDPQPARASQEQNLLGVLGFALATQDASQSKTFLNNAVTAFRRAIDLDPANEDALFNLEYALGQLKADSPQQASGKDQPGERGSAGLKDAGRGY